MGDNQESGSKAGIVEGDYAGYQEWKRWETLFAYNVEEAAYFKGEMRDVAIAGADLLEIGFGAGSFLAWAHDQGARVYGIEIIAALIEAARANGVALLPTDFEKAASEHTAAFDTIVALDVFEHFSLSDLVARLTACERMLRPGGHLVLRFPNAQSPFGLACQYGDPTHKVALSRGVIEQLTQNMSVHVTRYSAAYRIPGQGAGKRLARALRYLARDLIAVMFNAIYTQSIPWDPVVVLVLHKALSQQMDIGAR